MPSKHTIRPKSGKARAGDGPNREWPTPGKAQTGKGRSQEGDVPEPGATAPLVGSASATVLCESGTMTRLVLKDELLDAQLLRTIGTAPYGGADVGECLATVARVDGTSLTSWHDAWVSTAQRLGTLAEAELAAGRLETAKDAFFRSSNYFRTAGVMLMGTPVDERLRATNGRQTEMFRKGAALLAQPPGDPRHPVRGYDLARLPLPGRR